MRVILFARYGEIGASSRLRHRQYIGLLREIGIEVKIQSFFGDDYLEKLYCGKKISVLRLFMYYVRRTKALLDVHKYDLAVIERELFPYVPPLFEWLLSVLGVRYVVDYDDAWFHIYDQSPRLIVRLILGGKIASIINHASAVTCGNDYVCAFARAAASKNCVVELIPTAIEVERYNKALDSAKSKPGQCVVIGWIGTPNTEKYLSEIWPALQKLKSRRNIELKFIGASNAYWKDKEVSIIPWSEETEADALVNIDIGIMPLPDTPIERGKSGYKILQYFALNIPVAASPVGINKSIVDVGEDGFLPNNLMEWERDLIYLIDLSTESRSVMGKHGKRKIETTYNTHVQVERMSSVWRRAEQRLNYER